MNPQCSYGCMFMGCRVIRKGGNIGKKGGIKEDKQILHVSIERVALIIEKCIEKSDQAEKKEKVKGRRD